MKFNVFICLKGAAAIVEAPATNNPIECDTIEDLLIRLTKNNSLPNNGFVKTVGVRIEALEE